MNLRSAVVTLCGMLLVAAAVLWLFDREISGPWFRLGVQPEITSELERSMTDQKALARFDPRHRDVYHARFEATEALLNHFRILEHNRTGIRRRWEMILLAAVLAVLAVAGGLHLLRQGRLDARLDRLRLALIALSDGQEDLEIGDRRRDVIGRIAGMIEDTSRAMARDRKRLASLKNLSGWQETARRHAHEIRTPLTAARLELTRLERLLDSEESRQVAHSVGEELERLGRFTRQFTSFARLPQPRPQVHDLGRVVEEFVTTFAAAWPNLDLRFEPRDKPLPAALDRDMLRQVLVNLCDNSSLAIRAAGAAGGERGTMTLRAGEAGSGSVWLDVADDGPGIAPEIRSRVFEPYATTRRVGEGMGLGLAICKKILLDHGGDLELRSSSGAGTTFRLTFPRRVEDAAA